jgi:hypothetical protein
MFLFQLLFLKQQLVETGNDTEYDKLALNRAMM